MLGNHALAGRRRSLAATRDWYQRLYRLLPDIHFTIPRITVRGWPWNTHATGVHIAEIKWARMTRLLILPDTVMLKAALDRLAAKHVAEAAAPPIEDAPGWPD